MVSPTTSAAVAEGDQAPAPSPATLRDLLARVKAATAPDRELDAAIALALRYQHDSRYDWTLKFPEWRLHWKHYGCIEAVGRAEEGGGVYWNAPPITASIDAALGLVARVLPGWACGFDRGPKTCMGFVDRRDYLDRLFGAGFVTAASSVPLAILAAALEALLATAASPVPAQAGG